VKLTLDSTEPLDDAMRVVGALYGVTLAVSAEEAEEPPSIEEKSTSPARRRRSARGRTPSGKARTATTAVRTGASAESIQEAEKTPPVPPVSDVAPSNAEVRSWARQSGLTISDRGRIPAAVVTAYQDSQGA
jgi:Lsr2